MREQITKILEFELIKVGDYSITPSEIFMVLLVLFVTKLITNLVKRYFTRLVRKGRFDEGRAFSFMKITSYAIWILAIAYCLDIVGVKITFLLAGSAALLVGVGLGLQQTFNDFISGIIIIFEGSVQEGDIIQLQNGTVGRVIDIQLRVSQIRTRDQITILIPNSKLVNDNVINWTHNRMATRFSVKVGVAYGSDVELVKKTLEEAAKLSDKIVLKNEPIARFLDFGDSALQFEVLFWVDKTFEIEFVKSDIRFFIDKLFHEKGIRIPFPQRDLHLKSSEINLG